MLSIFLSFFVLGGQGETVTSYIVTKTTADQHDDDENFEVQKKTRAPKKRKTTTTRPTTVVTKVARNRVTLPISALVENTECTFQGNMPDPDNCQCKSHLRYFYEHSSYCFILAYYTCKEDVIARIHCPDRQLFDEDNRLCNDHRKVFCANRPINERGADPCKTHRFQSKKGTFFSIDLGVGQQNGWYADTENQCRVYYLCTEQRKTKMGECPAGSKWNSQRLRCDDPRNILAPCKNPLKLFQTFLINPLLLLSFHLGGLRTNKGISLSHQHIPILLFSLLTFQRIVSSKIDI